MIKKFQEYDIEEVLDIWLKASIIAHDFIDSSYWVSELNNMRQTYIPDSETYVYENQHGICGFFSLNENILAAIFIKPVHQGKGIGTKLLKKAKELRNNLKLTVYKENPKSILFYKKAGFKFVKKQEDEHTGHSELILQWP